MSTARDLRTLRRLGDIDVGDGDITIRGKRVFSEDECGNPLGQISPIVAIVACTQTKRVLDLSSDFAKIMLSSQLRNLVSISISSASSISLYSR
jgi:hypothetical protein